MRIKLLICYLLLSVFNGYAQNNESSNYRLETVGDFSKGAVGVWLPGAFEDTTIRGSVYLNDSWDGLHLIKLKNGNTFSVLNLNYNLQRNTLESKMSKDSVFQVDAINVDFVKFGKKKFKFFVVDGKETLCNVLYQSPKVTLIKLVQLSVKKAYKNPATNEVIVDAAYVRDEKYMIRKNEENFGDFNLKKKKFMNFFGQNSEKLVELSKSKKFNFDSEEDIFSIFQFYDTL